MARRSAWNSSGLVEFSATSKFITEWAEIGVMEFCSPPEKLFTAKDAKIAKEIPVSQFETLTIPRALGSAAFRRCPAR